MDSSQKDFKSEKQGKKTFRWGILLALLVPLVAWMIDIFTSGLVFSFSSIAKIHALNPVHWFLDLIPFIAAFAFYYYSKVQSQRIEELEEAIAKKDESIKKNASFAKQIGEGNYEAELDIDKREDALGQSLLLMRDNLKANKEREDEENWIARGRDLIAGVLRMYNEIDKLSYEVLVSVIDYTKVIQGAFYMYNEDENKLVNRATYAFNRKKFIDQEFKVGYGLIGQCAYEQDIIYRTEIPDDYATITSGILGEKKPGSLIIVPLVTEEKLQGVMEFAAIEDHISDRTIRFLQELSEIIARTVYNLKINQQTEKLLAESQQMTEELQQREEELRQNAEEMRATQEELQKSNEKLETQVKEVENAQKRLYSLLENASEIIFIYDQKMKLKFISPSVTKILGFTPDEMMEGKDFDRLSNRGEIALKEMFDNLLNNPTESQSVQYTYMRKDGEKIYLETIGRNLLDDPAINGIILNSQDITSRKRAEKEERMRSKMQSLSENSMDMILRLNPTGQVFYANPIVEQYLGIQPKEILHKTINDIKLDENLKEYFNTTLTAIKSTRKKLTKEIYFNTEKGERIMSVDAIPEVNENELETILFVSHDITEAKRIEREIQDKNHKITESINYAQRIQTSILPTAKNLQEHFPKSFIFYKARDVVSGDFPWMFEKDDTLYVAAVDCTGHGVPGALLSFIGHFLLNNVVDHNGDLNAGVICDRLHHGVRKTLRQDHTDAEARDGMDIAFCKINKKKKELQYAGAHRPLFLLRGDQLEEYKGDRKAIGGIPHRKKIEKDFTNYTINYQDGDRIFLFSDGLTDQIGGPDNNRKYSLKKVRENLIQYHHYTMPKLANFFSKDHTKWLGKNKQLDDVLLIGIEL